MKIKYEALNFMGRFVIGEKYDDRKSKEPTAKEMFMRNELSGHKLLFVLIDL